MASPVTQPTAAHFCARCKSLNLESAFAGRWTERDIRMPVIEFGKPDTIQQDADCKLCQAFVYIAEIFNSNVYTRGCSSQRHCLYAIPSLLAHYQAAQPSNDSPAAGFLAYAKSQGDSTWLMVRNRHLSMSAFFFIDVPRSAYRFGCLAEYSADFNSVGQRVRLIDPDRLDLPAVKGWFDFCNNNHHDTCNAAEARRACSLIRGFKVINCHSRKLEHLPYDAKFVALSYVWGPVPATLSQFPQTIEDAIAVALMLDVDFIWVDRYCIPQHDCVEKREQIQNMHKIYRGAEFTIVAAAGDGPEYGLPGVSKARCRPPRVDIHVGGRRLLATGRSVEQAIQGTKWASRAWTYQEGLVSLKKLVFTDEQVYLHCMKREYRETIQQDHGFLAAIPDNISEPWETEKCPVFRVNVDKRQPDTIFYKFEEFSQRQMSFQSDALNAILGILELYVEAFPDRFRHVWGQPLFFDPGYSLGDIMAYGLGWSLNHIADRRVGFPSWSWIGWMAPIRTTVNYMKYKPLRQDISVQLVAQDGSLVDDAEVLRDPIKFQQLSSGFGMFIFVEAETINVRIHRTPHHWEPAFVLDDAEIRLHGGGGSGSFEPTGAIKEADALYASLSAGQTWLGLVLPAQQLVLVVMDKGGHYERIGHVQYGDKEAKRVPDVFAGRRKVRLG